MCPSRHPRGHEPTHGVCATIYIYTLCAPVLLSHEPVARSTTVADMASLVCARRGKDMARVKGTEAGTQTDALHVLLSARVPVTPTTPSCILAKMCAVALTSFRPRFLEMHTLSLQVSCATDPMPSSDTYLRQTSGLGVFLHFFSTRPGSITSSRPECGIERFSLRLLFETTR
ncbi:hypothetical protein BKA62DRAFT_33284 [Auriculariales sp. MPI-PUGE-AT-0066]|nr:hypothetical protein BKA62DRAFT_33284 [Auriculariales sp. MPI-PUGE-AT-0066]